MKFNIKDLELACMAVIAPPQQVSPDKRREAEEFIIEFRDKSSEFFFLFATWFQKNPRTDRVSRDFASMPKSPSSIPSSFSFESILSSWMRRNLKTRSSKTHRILIGNYWKSKFNFSSSRTNYTGGFFHWKTSWTSYF